MASILIMEDDPQLALDLRDLLEMHAHDVRWCRGATEALAVLREEPHDLVIADIYIYHDGRMVPDGGISLIGTMRMPGNLQEPNSLRDVPVLAISGASRFPGNEYILDVAKSLGAQLTLAKPYGDEEMMEMVEDLLGT